MKGVIESGSGYYLAPGQGITEDIAKAYRYEHDDSAVVEALQHNGLKFIPDKSDPGIFGLTGYLGPITRKHVYECIDGERNYQDMRRTRDDGQEHHSIEEFLLYMKVYLDETISLSAHTWGPEAAPKTLDFIRKVTALGVACMEQNGIIYRDGYGPTSTELGDPQE